MRRFVQVLTFDVAAKVVLGLVAIALIRYMPTEQYAALTLAASVATLAAQTLAAGFNRIYIVGYDRLALAGQAEPYLLLQLGLVALLGIAASPLAAAFSGLYGTTLALALAIVASEFSKTYYQRELRFWRYSTIEIGRSVAQAAGILGLIALYGHTLEAMHVLWVQTAALAAAFGLAAGPVLSWSRLGHPGVAIGLFRAIVTGRYAYLFAYFALLAVFSQTDVLMLKLLTDDVTLASYGAALRYYTLLSLALGAVHAVLLPAIQQATTTQELERLYADHFRLLGIFAPGVFLAGWAAGWVLPWVDRGRYPDAVAAFRVLAASTVISFAFSPHVNLLLKLERFRFLFLLIALALGVDIALNLVLIPRFGAVGAAWATLIASACVTVSIFFVSQRTRKQAT
jgi:O-antigen/teichoic acid export membrane protein